MRRSARSRRRPSPRPVRRRRPRGRCSSSCSAMPRGACTTTCACNATACCFPGRCRAEVEDMRVVPARRMPAARLVPSGVPQPMPAKLAPMLADAAEAPFAREGWMWEPKLDGYRVLAFVEGDAVTLRSRRGLDLSADFPALAAELAQQAAGRLVLDGEIVAFGADGKPSFGALQARAKLRTDRERE